VTFSSSSRRNLQDGQVEQQLAYLARTLWEESSMAGLASQWRMEWKEWESQEMGLVLGEGHLHSVPVWSLGIR